MEKLLRCFILCVLCLLAGILGIHTSKNKALKICGISKDQSCGICIPYLAVTAELGVLSHDGFEAVECPVVYERHFALTESAPSMTIRVVERSSAAEARQ